MKNPHLHIIGPYNKWMVVDLPDDKANYCTFESCTHHCYCDKSRENYKQALQTAIENGVMIDESQRILLTALLPSFGWFYKELEPFHQIPLSYEVVIEELPNPDYNDFSGGHVNMNSPTIKVAKLIKSEQ